MKIYLYNPDSGAPVKNWWDGHNYWSLAVGEVAIFPEAAGRLLKTTYAFLVEVSIEEYEAKLTQLEKAEPKKIKVAPSGEIVPKEADELVADQVILDQEKAATKKVKEKVAKAKEAEPVDPEYWELSRGDLINECHRRAIEIKAPSKVTKESLINLLENDDQK